MGIALDDIDKPSDDVVAREIEGKLSSVPLGAGSGDREAELFTHNDTGKAIGDRLDGQRSPAGVVAELNLELEAEDGAGERDVLGLSAQLVERRMLVVA